MDLYFISLIEDILENKFKMDFIKILKSVKSPTLKRNLTTKMKLQMKHLSSWFEFNGCGLWMRRPPNVSLYVTTMDFVI